MPRYMFPGGYRGALAAPLPRISRNQRRFEYERALRDQFDSVLIRAITLWGVSFVEQRVRSAIADAKAAR